MALQELLKSGLSLLPEAIGISVAVLALLGIRELFRETKIAFKKQARA